MVALLPVNAAGPARAATMLFLFPLLTRLLPSAARLAGCDRRCERSLGVNGPWKALGLDGVIIPRSARCLLDGFDPAGTLLLFSCRGSPGSGRFQPGDRPRWVRSVCAAIRFLLLSEGVGGNTVGPESTTAWERDGAVGSPRNLEPLGQPARRTRLCRGTGVATCGGHGGRVGI